MSSAPRNTVCLIGAGPGGCSVLHRLETLREDGVAVPNVVCFEKQSDWGGMWNLTWRTGVDEFGEPMHCGMYKGLWTNIPKEANEYSDYTYEEHFGQAIPSFVPREVMLDYMKGRWKKKDFRRWIKFSHLVRSLVYDDDKKIFVVVVKDLVKDRLLPTQHFTHVVVASGHFSFPNAPSLPGIETFPGRVIHSHDFRDSQPHNGKRILLVGAGLSGEDIAIQSLKYGASRLIIAHRTKPLDFAWPPEIVERPLVTSIKGNEITFADGNIETVDDIVLCTGYIHHYPFLEDRLKYKIFTRNWPENLYAGTTLIFNPCLFYVGAQNSFYRLPLLELQAIWVVDVLVGRRILPSKEKMVEEEVQLRVKESNSTRENDFKSLIEFQTEYIKYLSQANGSSLDFDLTEMALKWRKEKKGDPLTFRDQRFISLITGVEAATPKRPFMETFEETVEEFLGL